MQVTMRQKFGVGGLDIVRPLGMVGWGFGGLRPANHGYLHAEHFYLKDHGTSAHGPYSFIPFISPLFDTPPI